MNKIPWTSLSQLIAQYDYFLLDQFGVLRDDEGPYDGAAEALSELRSADKHVIVLSNSGRSGEFNADRFTQLGFGRTTFDRFVTSGDVAFEILASSGSIKAGLRVFTISSGGDTNLADRLDLATVDDAAEAELVIISGSEAERIPLERYREILEPAAARQVPCICTNPDIHKLFGGINVAGAGAIAEIYESLGGSVRWIGKPHREMYDVAMRAWGNPARSTVVCVGDSIAHDIKGAQDAQLASVLVRTGILSDASESDLEDAFATTGAYPSFLMKRFG
ncbi:TIGR01459 family HAD-type hydrolase [Rhizobium sp. Root1220]|uniref:TIGR01459 family HAD-type hydrolase n=1 Tax=Rhizobium sp. Root1220 TaxID=1736432 RepID=UPI000A4D6C31|nr:TIGR01459 family HAD-type hydrolase [Rhizobium sp. Root1220]